MPYHFEHTTLYKITPFSTTYKHAHNPESLCSNEGLMIETSASQTNYI